MNRMALNPEDTGPNDNPDTTYYPNGADVRSRDCEQLEEIQGRQVLLEEFVMVHYVVVRGPGDAPCECLQAGKMGPGA
jgi:hypothetical protein